MRVTGMRKRLSLKFLILLLTIAAIALSGTVILRGLMLRDFRAYLEGDEEDRVYGITADLESTYYRDGRWDADAQARNAVSAITLGFEMRLLDNDGRMVVDTGSALQKASPLVKRRLEALSQSWGSRARGNSFPTTFFSRAGRSGPSSLRPCGRPGRRFL